MDKNYKMMSRSLRCFLLVMVAMLTGLNANAQDIVVEDLILDQEYSGAAFNDPRYFKYTATSDGVLVTTGTVFLPTFDETFTTAYTKDQGYSTGGYSPKESRQIVEAGKTYYFKLMKQISKWNFTSTLQAETGIKFVKTVPANDVPFSVGNGGSLVLWFNTPIDFDGSYIIKDATTVNLGASNANKDYIPLELKDILIDWYNTGVLKAGDKFTIRLTGVKNSQGWVYQQEGLEAGVFEVTFEAAALPAMFVEAESYIPDPFKSYFPASTTEGLMVLAYDRELQTSPLPNASALFGVFGSEDVYNLTDIPVRVEGNKVYVDYRGVLRTRETLGLQNPIPTVRLTVNEIKDKDGNYVYADGKGNFGKFQQTVDYREITVDLTTEFTPASGSSLKGVNSIELFLSTADAVEFEGVMITYRDANGVRRAQTLSKAECGYEKNSSNEVILNIPVTAEMQSATNVEISLYQPVSLDGQEHPVSATYNLYDEIVPVAVSPADKSEVEQIERISLTFKMNVKVADNAVANVLSTNGREVVATGRLVATDDPKVLEIVLDQPYKEVGMWRVQIAAGVISNDLGETNEDITLGYSVVAPVVYGYVFSPAEGEVESLSVINLSNVAGLQCNWSPVPYLMNAKGEKVAKAKFTEIEDPDDFFAPITSGYFTLYDVDTFKDVVTITAPGEYTFVVPEGFFILGTGGANENEKELTVKYTIAEPAKPAGLAYTSVSPAPGEVESLEIIDLFYDVELDYNVDTEVTLTDADGNSYMDGAWKGVPFKNHKEFQILLDKAITAPGVYTLHIAKGTIFDEAGNENDDIELVYTIKAAATGMPEGMTADPADGSTVAKLDVITLTRTPFLAVESGRAEVYNAAGDHVAYGYLDTFIPEEEEDNFNYKTTVATIALRNLDTRKAMEISEPGVYTVKLPAGAFVFDAQGNTTSPAFELTYTVEADEPVKPAGLAYTSVSPAPGNVESLETIELFYDVELDNNVETEVTLTDADGKDYAVDAWKGVPYKNHQEYQILLGSTITAPGVYTLRIAKGTIFDPETGSENEDIELVYTIGESGVADVATDAAACAVSILDGDVVVAAAGDLDVAVYALDGSLIGAAKGHDVVTVSLEGRGVAVVRAAVNGFVTVKKIVL